MSGHLGYGRWLRIPDTTQTNQQPMTNLLIDDWYNLNWKEKDYWYHFDKNGVMQMGLFTNKDGKKYYLIEDINDNWYCRAVTGRQTIDGKTYNFDNLGALMQ